MMSDGWNYFTSIWNYIDVITPTTILSLLMINSFNIDIGDETPRIL